MTPKPIRQQSTIYLGIDPGKTGGIVSLFVRPDSICLVDTLEVMPNTERGIWDVFVGLQPAQGAQMHACIEWIHPAIQGIGKSPMSKLYGNYMQLRGFLVASEDIAWEEVKPKRWQQVLGVQPRKKSETRNQWKDRLRGHAQGLYPNLGVWGRTLGEQRAICDALLIATYCKRIVGGSG